MMSRMAFFGKNQVFGGIIFQREIWENLAHDILFLAYKQQATRPWRVAGERRDQVSQCPKKLALYC